MRKHKWVTWLIIGIAITAVLEVLVLLSILSSRSKESRESAYTPSPVNAAITPSATPGTFLTEPAPQPGIDTATTRDALEALSSARMFETLEDLTSIQPHSGWRGAGTAGEKEALDYLETRLDELDWLASQGMTREREQFNIFFGTEDHTSSLWLTVGSQSVEIPADATRGSRDAPAAARRMDSDGVFNGAQSSPVEAEGPVILVPDAGELSNLAGMSIRDKILFVDYALVETENSLALNNAATLLDLKPAAIVLVTKFSNSGEHTHGTFAGDGGGVMQRFESREAVPLLFVEMENLAAAGMDEWDEMGNISNARVIWDTDVLNPAPSGNLVVHVPGRHPERPILLSAHIDSPNSPGALDNGSGSVILMEILTVLNDLRIQPENDLYIAWYGSEEVGLYGSTYFTTTHSDLLGRLQANIQIDCLTRPLDGLPASIMPMYSHVSTSTLTTDPFKIFLDSKGADFGLELESIFYEFASDNGSLSAFNIPNTNLIYQSMEMENYPGGVWVAGHLHDPYDTVALARQMEPQLLDMARLTLAAALSPAEQIDFVQHDPQQQVVFLANHTEAPHMTPSGLSRFSKALINAGYGITVIPYGKAVTPDDISGADMVVVLPACDFPITDSSAAAYDTGWSGSEADVLNDYLEQGGKLLVVNSGNRLKFFNWVTEPNEDWADLNTLTGLWGVTFTRVGVEERSITATPGGLFDRSTTVNINPVNAVVFSVNKGEVLAGSRERAHIAKVKVGAGEVIVLSDLSMLGDYGDGLLNPALVQALTAWK
ncbi:MAG TPA: M28 family peptidase [Anaerolineaceae bacterium]|nr:M28 family peptidase [Anaerolineaceae bacterium]